MYVRDRRSLRLNGYDYGQAGAYFVTICTRDRVCLFGDIVDEEVRLSDAGKMIQRVWVEMPDHYPGIDTDAFAVMPNHIHGIIVIAVSRPALGAGPSACPDHGRTETVPAVGAGLALPEAKGAASGAPTLGDVIRAFKSLSAIRVNRLLMRSGPVWQRNYYEHVIRNDHDLDKIREYIATNPIRWALDRENPQRTGRSDEEDALFDLRRPQAPTPWK